LLPPFTPFDKDDEEPSVSTEGDELNNKIEQMLNESETSVKKRKRNKADYAKEILEMLDEV
jgi:hypothetical protein